MILDQYGAPVNSPNVEKMIAGVYETMTPGVNLGNRGISHLDDQYRRGYTAYNITSLMGVTGRAEDGSLVSGQYEQSLFYLSVDERISIFRLCGPVFAVVTGRMNRISAIPFNIISIRKDEDRQAEKLKAYYSLYKEYKDATELKYVILKARAVQKIQEVLFDVLPDLSNFQSSLLRWKKRIADLKVDKADEIKEWMMEPNQGVRWEDFIKAYVFDLMVHGQATIYKEQIQDRIENIYLLPGGTIMPLKSRYVGGAVAYAQLISGFEPKIYYQNELCYQAYIPSSARAYGMVPLEALVNKISENLLFDKLMADQADGTKPPEKLLVITNPAPFGDPNKEYKHPVSPEEQKRIEERVNQAKKGAIATLTFAGNDATVIDTSRENTMALQSQRQKDFREEIALVFQATNMEMNLTGSEDTSGRSTSEEQASIMHNRAILPILQGVESKWSREIIPFRFGWGFSMEYDTGKDEMADIQKIQAMISTGAYSINEIRTDELNKAPFPGEQFDVPAAGAGPQEPGSSEQAPQYTKSI